MSLSKKTQTLQNYIKNNQNISDISQSEISRIYQDLIDCITDHNHLYYIESDSIISDFEYDQLFDYLKKIEQSFPYMISWNSPTQKLVNQIQDDFKKGGHKIPMLSLENSYNGQDIKEWEDRILKIINKVTNDSNGGAINPAIQTGHSTLPYPQKDIIYNIEPKFDGISIELIYQDWKFLQAITRWDGLVWEDVTENVKTIKNIPKILKKNLPWTISFRWEILIWKSELAKINKEREKQWLQLYANTRNLASWSLKQLDPNITASRNLQCFVYEILYTSDISSKWIKWTHGKISSNENKDFSQDMTVEMTVENLWLPNYPIILSSNDISEIINVCENPKTKENLQKEDIDFDGLVIKVKDDNLREIIWSTNHHPRRAVAYKFPADQVSTQIKSVEFQVWRTWIITPVANLEPVNLSGATISRVSLHNFDFIKEKDIHYNDFVRVQRSWEVIPYIVWVITERRNNTVPLTKGDKGGSKLITAPTHCPSCWTALTPVDMHYYCQNPECPDQIKEKIIRFVSKDCMDIEWIWESIVEILVDHNIVKDIADLYNLLNFETERIVRRFPWFADKKITEIQKQLQESKKKEFRRLLNWLWIPGIWKKTAKDIYNVISTETKWNGEISWTNLEHITQYLTKKEFLISIYWVWEKIVEWIINYRNNNYKLLQKLEQLWLNFSTNQSTLNSSLSTLNSFSITGSFDIPRPKIIEEMEKNWYTFDPNPTKNTKYMLIWSKPWNKLAKAEEFWTEIINSRENITKKFPFLLEIKIEKTKKWPEQIGLF